MGKLGNLLDNNKSWAAGVSRNDSTFFERLAHQQSPKYLWIGCSDSRVPANQIIGLLPGEIFVHRNVANLVVHTDLNCLSVIQYAVDVLKVEHIIVCGHYGCGGIAAALSNQTLGLISNWLRHVQDVGHKHKNSLGVIDNSKKTDLLCELNVVEQVINVCQTTVVEAAWERGQNLTVHGWIYGISNGIIRDLGICAQNSEEAQKTYRTALEGLGIQL